MGRRLRQRVEMAGLAGEIKKKLALLDQGRHRGGVANVSKIDSHSIADVVNIEKIAAVFRDQAVHQRHLCAELDQVPGEGGTDETKASGNENVGTGKNVRIPGHG